MQIERRKFHITKKKTRNNVFKKRETESGEDIFQTGPVKAEFRNTSSILMCTHDGGENAI